MRRSAVNQIAQEGVPFSGLQMVGNWKGVTAPIECIDNVSKEYDDRMSMLDGEEIGLHPKKLKASGNYENEAGGVV